MSATRVLVDANVLFSRTLRDWLFLLRNASEATVFTVGATEDIVAETIYRFRRQKPTAPGHLTTRIHDRIMDSLDFRVDDYVVDGSYPGTDQNDAHVHAATIADDVDILLTADKGFADLEPQQIEALPYEIYNADEFFVLIDGSQPHVVRAVTADQLDYWLRKVEEVDLCGPLRVAGCPRFAERVRAHLQTISPPKPT